MRMVNNMDKWNELHQWVESGIKSLDKLGDEYKNTNLKEYKRLQARINEFNNFLNKMDEIEKMCENKYQCLKCGIIATETQWNEAHKQKYDEYGFTIDSNNREKHVYVCPGCGSDIVGQLIEKM
jgi:ribosomal protein L37AE/L43A